MFVYGLCHNCGKEIIRKEWISLIITVENSVAQNLHVNPQMINDLSLTSPEAWSVRISGDFMIIMNNLLALPVIIRHPQRFNNSRSFITAFKQAFLRLMEQIPIPHAKVRLVRNAQFQDVRFTSQQADSAPLHLQTYQNALTGPNSTIDWDNHPSNVELALQLAKQTELYDPDADDSVPVLELFANYVLKSFSLPAHPDLNEHNRNYRYHSGSLNDVMNAVAVDERLLKDYRQYLQNRGKSDQVIDRDLDTADDYFSFCDGYEKTILDDLTLVYNYLLQYEETTATRLTATQLRDKCIALRELGRFMRYQRLFSAADFDQFVQAIGQGANELVTTDRNYYFQRLLRNVQNQVQDQRDALTVARHHSHQRYQLTVTLAGYQPAMWRQFDLSSDTRLDSLCYQVLASFRANGRHLFNLQDQEHNYQLPIFDSGLDTQRNLLAHWLGEYQVGDELLLTYDFGDSWHFKIKIDKVTAESRLRATSPARLLAGSGRGIIDDIGGVAGLTDVAKDDPTIDQSLNINKEQVTWLQRADQLRKHYR